MSEFFHIDPRIEKAAQKALELCRESFLKIEEITEYNQQKMLAAFRRLASAKAILQPLRATAMVTGAGCSGPGLRNGVPSGECVGAAQFCQRDTRFNGGSLWCASSGRYHAQRYRNPL